MVDVLVVVLPVLVALLLGYVSKRKGILVEGGIQGLKTLVMRFMLPAVLFGAFYKTIFTVDLVLIAVTMFLCCLGGFLLGSVCNKLFKVGGGMLPFLTTGFEAGMMGYGLYTMLFSSEQTGYFALVDLGQVIFVFTLYTSLLNRKKGISLKKTIHSMLTDAVFVAIVCGVIFSATGLGQILYTSSIGSVLEEVVSYIGTPTGVLMIFVVGYQLEWSKACIKSALATALLRSVIMAVLGAICLLLLNTWIEMEEPLFYAFILMFTLPAPFVLPIYSGDEEQKGYVATSLSFGTLLSILYFVILSFLV